MYRKAHQAGFFYPATKNECQNSLLKCIKGGEVPIFDKNIIAGIVPHAGWDFSGAVAAKVFNAVSQQKKVDTFVIFGAAHSCYIKKAAIWNKGDWETPIGNVCINEEFVNEIIKDCASCIGIEKSAHEYEHSIEVQVPFIKHLFPDAKIVPIMVPPFEGAVKVGEYIAKLAKDKNLLVLGSTDMTHYGSRFNFNPAGTGEKALKWVKEVNDKRLIDLILELKADKIVKEATQNASACGAGAITATVSYAKAMGSQLGTLLEHTTSCEILPAKSIDTFVSYASFIFQ